MKWKFNLLIRWKSYSFDKQSRGLWRGRAGEYLQTRSSPFIPSYLRMRERLFFPVVEEVIKLHEEGAVLRARVPLVAPVPHVRAEEQQHAGKCSQWAPAHALKSRFKLWVNWFAACRLWQEAVKSNCHYLHLLFLVFRMTPVPCCYRSWGCLVARE